MNIIVNNLPDKGKEELFQCGGFLDMQIEWNHLLLTGPNKNQDGANNSSYLCLLLIIQFLSRLCNIFLARSIALKEFYLMMNFEKNSFYRF